MVLDLKCELTMKHFTGNEISPGSPSLEGHHPPEN